MISHSDIERELYTIFTEHPHSQINESGEPVIPADAVVDVFRSLSDVFSVPLLSVEETDMLKTLLASNPGLEVTPTILLQFIAEKTRLNSPKSESPVQDIDRGREQERYSPSDHHRSASAGSSGYTGSRSSSRDPHTPFNNKSPFDIDRRQRSTPLTAPSSWSSKRPAPASRRRSFDGAASDSEYTAPPFARSTSGRTRAPSNPASPPPSNIEFSPIGSPNFSGSYSRPLSRTGSQSAGLYSNNFSMFGSPSREYDDDENDTINSNSFRSDDSFGSGKNSMPMPTNRNSDSDSDDDADSSLGLVLERNTANSTASMEPMERLEALQKVNSDLGRKLMEAERTLQKRLGEHESELEEMQGRLEEMRSELSATKREEKELRSKERQNTTQISALELEITKVTKALEHAKSTYASLQRQYQEQCSASEKYRADLRNREELIRSLRDAASLHDVEVGKWQREQQGYEDRIAALEEELTVAQQAHSVLDEQKQENLLLKETIDRMRFEMDDMRSNAALGLPGGSGSNKSTMNKSLGAELMGKMQWDQSEEDAEDTEEDAGSDADAESSVTVVEEDGTDDEEEDVIQTIITRKKRKVGSRAKTIETRTFEETKEYSDSAVQYDPTLFCVSTSMQTLPSPKIPVAEFAAQTEIAETRSYSIQTDTEEKPKMSEMEIQTDTIEESEFDTRSLSTSPSEGEESLASSSSTILPPTPKASTLRGLPELGGDGTIGLGLEIPLDSPPTYHQVAEQRKKEEEEWRLVSDVLGRWHTGAGLSRNSHSHSHGKASTSPSTSTNVVGNVNVDPITGGVSEDLVEEWKAFKEDLGVDCLVIDKLLEGSIKVPSGTSQPTSPTPSTSTSSSTPSDDQKKRRGRFYNIYNTYVYGSSSSSSDQPQPQQHSKPTPTFASRLMQLATQTIIFASASAIVFMAMSPYLIPPSYFHNHSLNPSGFEPNWYDRAAWASFNSIGGGGGEGIAFSSLGASAGSASGKGLWSWLFGSLGWGWWGAATGNVGVGNLGGGVAGNGGIIMGNGGADADAVWRVLGRVGGGAARMARGWPT